MNKICTNFIAKMAKLFKLKEILKFFYSFCPNFYGGAISGNLAEARKCRPHSKAYKKMSSRNPYIRGAGTC